MAEWEMFPQCRKRIRQEIADNPEWGIEDVPGDRPYLRTDSTITVTAESMPIYTEIEPCPKDEI